MIKKHRLHFRNENVTVFADEGENLRGACLQAGVDPYPMLGGMLSCRGKGFCGTCVVEVNEPEHLSDPSKRERKFLASHHKGMGPGLRLSCQASVLGDVTVTTIPDLRPAWKQHGYYSGLPTRSWETAE